MTATVNYKIATYKGDIQVSFENDEDDDIIINKAKQQLIKKVGPLPLGYRKFEITNKTI